MTRARAHPRPAPPTAGMPVLLVAGEHDPLEFRRQMAVFFGELVQHSAVDARCDPRQESIAFEHDASCPGPRWTPHRCRSLVCLPGEDHFTAIECLGDRDAPLTHLLLALLRRAASDRAP